MPWWAHSRKARLSRVYAFKGVDPFVWVKVWPSLGQVLCFLKVKGDEGVEMDTLDYFQ
jgi:hypothetical protein